MISMSIRFFMEMDVEVGRRHLEGFFQDPGMEIPSDAWIDHHTPNTQEWMGYGIRNGRIQIHLIPKSSLVSHEFLSYLAEKRARITWKDK